MEAYFNGNATEFLIITLKTAINHWSEAGNIVGSRALVLITLFFWAAVKRAVQVR